MNQPAGKQISYNYTADFSSIGANTVSNPYNIVTDSDSVFEIITQQLCVFSSDTENVSITAGNHFPGVYCTLYDTQVGRFITGGKTPITNIFGTSQYPNVLPKSHWLMRRSVLEVIIYNESIYDLDFVQLMFSGIKHTVQGE